MGNQRESGCVGLGFRDVRRSRTQVIEVRIALVDRGSEMMASGRNPLPTLPLESRLKSGALRTSDVQDAHHTKNNFSRCIFQKYAITFYYNIYYLQLLLQYIYIAIKLVCQTDPKL